MFSLFGGEGGHDKKAQRSNLAKNDCFIVFTSVVVISNNYKHISLIKLFK